MGNLPARSRELKKHTDSTEAHSYFVPLIETDETIAYQALIDSLKEISPAHSKPKLLSLSKE